MLYGYDVNGLCQKNNLEMESIGAWICRILARVFASKEDTRLFCSVYLAMCIWIG